MKNQQESKISIVWIYTLYIHFSRMNILHRDETYTLEVINYLVSPINVSSCILYGSRLYTSCASCARMFDYVYAVEKGREVL